MKLKYTGDHERVFPDHSLTVTTGDIVELELNPDARYFAEIDEPKAPTKTTSTKSEVTNDTTNI